MFDPHNFEPLNGVSEPTPQQKHRAEYYAARRARKAAKAKRPVSEPSVDVTLLRAQFMTRVGRFIRFA
ncbi:MAG: hypothetical protein C0506_08580 [Anaerolinea sp.]|nr:hypothetical protein [Anaerolinea sp.]